MTVNRGTYSTAICSEWTSRPIPEEPEVHSFYLNCTVIDVGEADHTTDP